jgi:hypothetical protein
MELVKTIEDPDTGISSLYLLAKDERGLDREPLKLGKDLADAYADPSAEASDAIGSAVTAALASDYLHEAKREELMSKVMAELDAVKAQRKNPLDKVVRAYTEATRLVDTIVHQR